MKLEELSYFPKLKLRVNSISEELQLEPILNHFSGLNINYAERIMNYFKTGGTKNA